MSDPYLEKALRLNSVAEPIESPTAQDWMSVEEELGIGLPADYKELVTMFGSGHFGELSLLNPVSSSEYTRLSLLNLQEFSDRVNQSARSASISLYPNSVGHIWIGVCGNGMELLLRLRRSGIKPYDLAWWDLDYNSVTAIDLSLARFLHDLYLGLIPTDWAIETRGLIWGSEEPFFTSRPGKL
jgi:hypothetical protein